MSEGSESDRIRDLVRTLDAMDSVIFEIAEAVVRGEPTVGMAGEDEALRVITYALDVLRRM